MSLALSKYAKLKTCSIFSPGLPAKARTSTDAQDLRNNGYDILQFVRDIHIYENLFDNTLSGSITVYENIGLIEYLPIVGIEFVQITFVVDTVDQENNTREFSRLFRISRVTNITYPQNDFRLYTLQLVSPQFVASLSSRISKAFPTTTCADAVKSIVRDYLFAEDRLITCEPTFGTVDITLPYYTPLQAINFFSLLAQTVDSPRDSSFLFFETLDGFHFTSLAQLITTGLSGHIRTFTVDPSVSVKRIDDTHSIDTIQKLDQERLFDVPMDIASGMVRSRMVHFDFLARQLTANIDSRYDTSFADGTHLDQYPVYPKNYDTYTNDSVRIFTVPSNVWSTNSNYIKSKDAIPEQRMREAIIIRNRRLREIQHIQTVLDIPGQPDIRVGSVVNIMYPSTRHLQDADISVNTPRVAQPTPYYSGPHLITGVHHTLTMITPSSFTYTTTLKACRDSLSSPLPILPERL